MTEPQPDSPAETTGESAPPGEAADEQSHTPTAAAQHSSAPTPAGEKAPDVPKPYDFRAGNELSRDSLLQLRIRCQRLCKVLGPVASAYLDTAADTEMEMLEATSFEQCLQNLPDSAAVAFIEVAGHLSEIAWEVDGNLVGGIVGRMLGGPALHLDRPPTALEAALLGRFIEEMVDVWAATWEGLAQREPTVREVVVDLAQLQTMVRDEEVAWLAIRTRVGDEEGTMNVYLPLSTIQRLLEAEESSVQATAAPSPLVLTDPVGQVKVPVSLVVHQSTISLREAMRLRPGDVIPLRKPLDAPLTVAVRGRAKFLAQAGVRQGYLAARLLAPSDDFAP